MERMERWTVDVLKTIAAIMLSPMTICLGMQLVGWLAMWRRQIRPGLAMIGAGTVILAVGGLSGVTYESRRKQEYTFAPLDVKTVGAGDPVVVVLGTGFNPDSELPANSRVSGVFLSRFAEGARICNQLPNSPMLVSVAGEATEKSKSDFLDEITQLFQVERSRIHLISHATSTRDEAKAAMDYVDGQKVIVVTSASHMVRAMTIFEDVGLIALPAPTAYQLTRRGSPGDRVLPRWIPSTDGVNSNHQWLYEMVALLWHRLGGQ